MRVRIILLCLFAGVIASCSKSLDDEERAAIERNETVMARVSDNIAFFRSLVAVSTNGDCLASFREEEGCWDILWDNGVRSALWPDPSVEDAVPPTLSVEWLDGGWYWFVNGDVLSAKGGRKISVLDSAVPVLSVSGADWTISLAGQLFTYRPEDCRAIHKACVEVNYDESTASFRFPSGASLVVDRPAGYSGLKMRDANRAFYKDLFLDAGLDLTDRKTLPAADYLGLSVEGVSNSSETFKEWERGVLGGNAEDTNGRLLYPDGQPRYRVLFVVGGKARNHGKSIGDTALSRMRTFNARGGSYVGTCAGGIFASTGFADEDVCPYYLHLWPALLKYTGLSATSTGMFVEEDSPLLAYYDYGGDRYLSEVRHNGGAYPVTFPAGTEILARYDREDVPAVHRQPSVWAYKADDRRGRVVMEGSHPEEYQKGENRDLTAAMIRYALDGQGTTELKAVLKKGKTYTAPVGIGDLQCHHFAFWLPEAAEQVSLSVNGQADWSLYLAKDGFAYPGEALMDSQSGHLETGSLEAGLWYVSVQCRTTVTVTETEIGQDYSGRTDVLNGIPYTISIDWE